MTIFSRSVLLGALVWATGCTQEKPTEESVSSKVTELPMDLKQMQGQWKSRNDTGTGTAQVEGYTVRLTYETPNSKTQFKRNVCIKKLDAVNRQLEIHGDKQPWQYLLERNNTHAYLELRFYDESQHKWVHSSLERPAGLVLVAGH